MSAADARRLAAHFEAAAADYAQAADEAYDPGQAMRLRSASIALAIEAGLLRKGDRAMRSLVKDHGRHHLIPMSDNELDAILAILLAVEHDLDQRDRTDPASTMRKLIRHIYGASEYSP